MGRGISGTLRCVDRKNMSLRECWRPIISGQVVKQHLCNLEFLAARQRKNRGDYLGQRNDCGLSNF